MAGRLRWMLALLAVLALVATACGSSDDGGDDAAAGTDDAPAEETEEPAGEEEELGEPIRIGIVSSTSGLLASYGNQYVEGFEIGLDYATGGTGVVAGHPLEVTFHDDAADAEQATSIATDLVGQGYKILAGSVSSAAALQMGPFAAENQILFISGPAAADAITGLNRYTFRSGRQTWQDVQTAAEILGDVSGKKVLVFAQDYAFGQANAAAVQAVLGDAGGATVESVLVPLDTNDFTPFARRVVDANPDLLFTAWAGETAPAMWQSLDQQGVFDATTVVTGLDQRASYDTAFGETADKIDFLSHYFVEAADNEANDFLEENVSGAADLFTPDGFVAAQMIVHAIEEAGGGDDVDALIAALEGWTFDAPKGTQTIRAEDHAMIQPMFQARLTGSTPELVEVMGAEAVAPPAGSFE
ncbi:MAG: substrate-binding domain-containing protein [Nitriliruptorales bacterium]